MQPVLTNKDDVTVWVDGTGKIGWATTGGYSTDVLPLQQWCRVVMVFDDGNATYYADGKQIYTGSEDQDGRLALDLAGMYIGADRNKYDGEFDLAEMRIWDKALSAAQADLLGGVPTE